LAQSRRDVVLIAPSSSSLVAIWCWKSPSSTGPISLAQLHQFSAKMHEINRSLLNVSTPLAEFLETKSIFADVGARDAAAHSQVHRREMHLIHTTEDLRRTFVDLPHFFGEHTAKNLLTNRELVKLG
jgi:hypothetical protein